MVKAYPYHERLLHWIWENRQFNFRKLASSNGQAIRVYDTGRLNRSDGPDFKDACIHIGRLTWYGDVEIHWKVQDWNKHGHRSDANYNNVVLHVVYHPAEQPTVYRKDGSAIPTLFLEPNLEHPLRQFLERSQTSKKLPCSKQFTYISRQAFEQQLSKAHKEYFEAKVTDLMAYYDPSLPVSRAWRHMTALALFDGLGISQNREPMRQLCRLLLKVLPESSSHSDFIAEAASTAGLSPSHSDQDFGWKHKGSRPNNHPKVRVRQGASLLWHFFNKPVNKYLKLDISNGWNDLNAQLPPDYSIGEQRRSTLYGTVWLPALFVLGQLFYAKKLKSSAWQNWKDHGVEVPSSLLSPFQSLPVPQADYRRKLGSVYQLRQYCLPRKCEACKVFKSIISA